MELKPSVAFIDKKTEWEKILISTLDNRKDYLKNNSEVRYTQVCGIFTGTFDDKDTYSDYLFLLDNEEENDFKTLFKGMNKEISPNTQQVITTLLNMNREKELSINRFMAHIIGNNILPLRNTDFEKYYDSVITKVFTKFIEKNGMNYNNFQRVVIDLIKWGISYFNDWFKEIDFTIKVPRILWFGEASESQKWFLYLLIEFGCDVIIFNPKKENIMKDFNLSVSLIEYTREIHFPDFPQKKSERFTTIAQQASSQIQELLYDENSGIYRPFQLKDYKPNSIHLLTTYMELFQLSDFGISERQGFKVENGEVFIPVIFSKVNGVLKNRQEYWNNIQKITDRLLLY